jgi:hypothetical protein
MSAVKFLCPNGHPLNAPQNLVGKAGRCPKCSTAFVVPAPEIEEPASNAGANKGPEPAGSSPLINLGSGIREGSNVGSQTRPDRFVFLCPNGHKLNGPAALKGKLGQCPHCGARFRIPEDDPEPELIDGAELVAQPPRDLEQVEQILPEELAAAVPEPPFEVGVHPLAHIMNRLWYHKGDSGEIELLLPEGEIMSPEHYSPELSSKEYGVFATREALGYSFSVVPWANVRRVNVHKVEHLPLGAFLE